MRNIYYKNADGFTLDLHSQTGLFIEAIDGLGTDVTINTSSSSGYDGSTEISEQLDERIITMTLLLNNSSDKAKVKEAFQLHKYGVFLYQEDNGIPMKIECKVSVRKIPPLEYPIHAQISLLCTNPYFQSLTETTVYLATITPEFIFPFTLPFPPETFKFSSVSNNIIRNVNNPSDVDVGMKVVFTATSELTNPELLNINTGERIKIDKDPIHPANPFTMLADDVITVSTIQGNKIITLTRSGTDTNIINSKTLDFKFMQLHSGDNLFRYYADTNLNGLQVKIIYTQYYSGV